MLECPPCRSHSPLQMEEDPPPGVLMQRADRSVTMLELAMRRMGRRNLQCKPQTRAAARPAEAHPVHPMKAVEFPAAMSKFAGILVRRCLVEPIQSRRTGGAGEVEDGRSAS